MKKIILGLIAGTMLSTTAFAIDKIDASKLALPAEGQVCSDLHDRNTGGINVKELSPYHQCVMIENDMDTGFTYKTFWTKVDNMFIPHDVDKLGPMSDSERKEMIKETIIKEVVVEKIVTVIEEKIIENTDKIEELKAQIVAKNALIQSITTISNNNAALVSQLAGALNEAHRQLGVWEAAYDRLEAENLRLEMKISDLENAEVNIDELRENAKANPLKIDDERNDAGIHRGSQSLDTFDRSKVTKNNEEVNVSEYAADNFSATATSYANGKVFGITISAADLNKDVAGLTLRDVLSKSTKEIIEEVADSFYAQGFYDGFQDGYSEGYNDGYQDGYTDGYQDGFNDGVASVR